MQRNWLGGGNNKGTNPLDWSPNGTPQTGDSLFAEGTFGNSPFPVYTLNVRGNDLAGDTLTTFFANVTVNASHRAVLNVIDSNGTDTFNLANRSTLKSECFRHPLDLWWVLDRQHARRFYVAPGQWRPDHGECLARFGLDRRLHYRNFHGGKLTITGGKHAAFHNDVSSASFFADVTVPMDVLGKGTFEVSSGARLEFMGSVGKNQSVTVSNFPQFGGGKLVIDHPHQFHGEVTLSLPASQLANQPAGFTRPEIDLQGILNADSYAYDFQKDLLSIYHGNKVLDTLRLENQSFLGFIVEQKPTKKIAIVAALAPKRPTLHQTPCTNIRLTFFATGRGIRQYRA